MGGYQFYDIDGPCYALDPETVVQLVRVGEITAPAAEEVADRSKGDMLSKGLAVIQTLWFVTQCIARSFEHLPLTNLEVITLAYTVITVAMYIAWWEKPLNVRCPIRVSIRAIGSHVTHENGKWHHDGIGGTIMDWVRAYIDGTQDKLVKLEGLEGVPTFWTGMATRDVTLLAHFVSIFVAVSFAAVHYITWSSAFPSPLEQQLWRWSTVGITGVPVALLACLMLARLSSTGCANAKHWSLGWWGGACGLVVLAIGGPIYICARGTLFGLSFITLRFLPITAYRIVQWSELIPHI
ncbi:hypothetical protein FIBSPDRAFT_765494 [Athelia psychrophila]|uniref:Uncharacterized protein n=1 Tax=Athelia psychrophila TaxID=1759441 RepID=A0A167W5V0_9AGAM|nr:hypothetical protein FIBSPDRAFT_765494 [Fibularhizoctonia sp. CBS 109695]